MMRAKLTTPLTEIDTSHSTRFIIPLMSLTHHYVWYKDKWHNRLAYILKQRQVVMLGQYTDNNSNQIKLAHDTEQYASSVASDHRQSNTLYQPFELKAKNGYGRSDTANDLLPLFAFIGTENLLWWVLMHNDWQKFGMRHQNFVLIPMPPWEYSMKDTLDRWRNCNVQKNVENLTCTEIL